MDNEEISDHFIIFPNSLFADNPFIDHKTVVYIVEHPVYFELFKFHKLKLILHRASMKYYEDYLKEKYKCRVKYIEIGEKLEKELNKGVIVDFYDPVDHLVMKDIKRIAKKINLDLVIHDTPLFINTSADLDDYGEKDKYRHDDFYRWMRKRHDSLMNGNKPRGGKWSFDTDNRKPFPANYKDLYNPRKNTNKYVKEAIRYVNRNFPNNPGSIDFLLPIDHDGAKRHFKAFLKDRFKCFGPYQDAVDSDIDIGCHSFISPLLNIGLITPKYIIEEAEEYGIKKRIPIASLEGFIRQVIGWREFNYLLYEKKRVELAKGNHFNHRRMLPDVWFEGVSDNKTTGFHVLDDLIDKAHRLGYLHHIERLMYIGNWMLINKTHPDNVFRWFMELSMDSYNWVMYPNIYGMSQHSAGDIMTTRPYFSSSAYIDRMSDYKRKKGECLIKIGEEEYEWYEIWDAIYYNFISENRKEFKKNYAISRQVKHWDNKDANEKKEIKKLTVAYNKYY